MLWASTLAAWSAIALTGSTAMSYFSYILRHDLRPTFERLFDIYFLPPAGPAFWAMNFSILAIALTAFAAVRSHRLRVQALWDAAQTELRDARLEVAARGGAPAGAAGADQPALPAEQPERDRGPGADRRARPRFRRDRPDRRAAAHGAARRPGAERQARGRGRLPRELHEAVQAALRGPVPLLRVDAGGPRRTARAGADRAAAHRELDQARHGPVAPAVRGRARLRARDRARDRGRGRRQRYPAGTCRPACRGVTASRTWPSACGSASGRPARWSSSRAPAAERSRGSSSAAESRRR